MELFSRPNVRDMTMLLLRIVQSMHMYATDINLPRKNKEACISWSLCCLHTGVSELHQKEYSGIQHW